jgi:hypothetical protein
VLLLLVGAGATGIGNLADGSEHVFDGRLIIRDGCLGRRLISPDGSSFLLRGLGQDIGHHLLYVHDEFFGLARRLGQLRKDDFEGPLKHPLSSAESEDVIRLPLLDFGKIA